MSQAIAPFVFHQGTAPLLISMPHTGTHVPADIAARLTPEGREVHDTDWHMPQLYDFAKALGASILVATHSRYVIDLNRPPHDLSGGQAARVSLARTLLTRPKVLLADEVDAGLDDDNAEKVARILAKAAADGMAIVRIRHRPPDGHATRVTRLADGTLTQSGNAEADGTATGSTSTGNTVEGSVA